MWKFIKRCVFWGFVTAILGFGVLLIDPLRQATTATPTPLADCSLQAKRVKLIGDLQRKGVIYKIERSSLLPHVYITPRFRFLNVDTKQTFLGLISAHEWCAGRGDHFILRDSQSGQRLGDFSAALGLRLP